MFTVLGTEAPLLRIPRLAKGGVSPGNGVVRVPQGCAHRTRIDTYTRPPPQTLVSSSGANIYKRLFIQRNGTVATRKKLTKQIGTLLKEQLIRAQLREGSAIHHLTNGSVSRWRTPSSLRDAPTVPGSTPRRREETVSHTRSPPRALVNSVFVHWVCER